MTAIEDKIAALLAKAEGTNFPAEAEAFMAKAEELMLKFGGTISGVEFFATYRQSLVNQAETPTNWERVGRLPGAGQAF